MYTSGTAWESSNRKITATLEVYDTTSSTQGWKNIDTTSQASHIKSFNLKENASNGKSITFGTSNSSCLTLSLINVESVRKNRLPKGANIRLSITATATGYTDSTVMLGYFIIDEPEWTPRKNGNYDGEITAYDYFYLTEKKADLSGFSGSSTVRNVISYIATKCGVTADTSKWSNTLTIDSYPEDVSYRQLIGYLAGLQGNIAFFNRSGQLSAKWYTEASYSSYITLEKQYMEGLVLDNTSSGDVATIRILESGTADNPLVYGGETVVVGESISFENPFMTNAILQSIYNSKVKSGTSYLIEFVPMSVKWTGNPTIELCEIVSAQIGGGGYTCYIMEREIVYDGGLYETYVCKKENEETIAFSRNFSLASIKRRLSSFETAMQEANEHINDINLMNTGVYSLLKNSDPSVKTNVGWQIIGTKATPTSSVTPVIRATINGIVMGNMTDSTGSMVNPVVAIYVDSNGVGHINGSLINAQSITTQMLNFDPVTTSNLNTELNKTGIAINGSQITNINTITGYSDLMTVVNGKASVSQATQAGTSAAVAEIATFTRAHDLTNITPEGLYTGMVTAEQMNVGWASTNQAGYSWSGDIAKYTTTIEDGLPKLTYTGSYSTTDEYTIYSIPFYASKGSTLAMSGYTYIGNTGWMGGTFQYSSSASGTYTNVDTSKYWSNSTSGEFNFNQSAPYTGYYRARIWIAHPQSRSYISKFVIGYSVEGSMIVNGKIKSLDGYTYFDLSKGELACQGSCSRAILHHCKDEINLGDVQYTEFNGLVFFPHNTTVTSQTDVNDADFYIVSQYLKASSGSTTGTFAMGGIRAKGDIAINANDGAGNLYLISRQNWGSTEDIKENIEPYTESVLAKVKASKIYSFDYKSPTLVNVEPPLVQGSNETSETSEKKDMGFVVERETPEEIISKNGKFINPYTMMSMNWKATQELLAKIESLEERLDGLTGDT